MTDVGWRTPQSSYTRTIGPYHILRLLGEGGMGMVYEAEELEPVRRRIALKVVRQDLASADVLARFDTERQALAVMSHPCIARVLHAGATDEGQPYFAMELVKGPSLTEYCDAHRLTLGERLKLFVDVCHAVQHAHQKGVIHRDLKPSNILVTEVDGHPQPKIIDFGIAKALGRELGGSTAVTMTGQAMGTAGYMSPEQAGASELDVDTRADVYSLGVILYELLVGKLPIDPDEVGLHVFLARLALGDTAPPTPSKRLSTLGVEQQSIAYARRTEPSHLVKELHGDLGWIALKAIENDRARRYETVNALAADVERVLANEPITARPPSTTYRFGKFVRRHRAAFVGGTATFLAIVAGATFSFVGMVRATRAERRAAEEAAAARQVTDFLVGLFRVSDPGEARGNAITAREILDRGAQRVDRELAGQPALQSRILQTMGTVYGALGLYDPARRLLDDALHEQQRGAPPTDSARADLLVALGAVTSHKGDFGDAERFLTQALALRPRGEGRITAMQELAALRARQGRAAAAESLYKQVLAIETRGGREASTRTLSGLAAVYWSQQRYADVEPLWRRTLAEQERTLGPDHPDVAATLNNLGALYFMLGRYADALPLYERTRAIFERTLGPNHPDLASALNNLGETEWKLSRFRESEPLFRRALAIKEQVLAPDHPSIAVTLNGLAGLLRDQRRFAEAEPLYQRALSIRERALGPTHPSVAETLRDYAEMLRRADRPAEAAPLEARAAKMR
jgi:eukaryotic-like serine/threonine-protein kinase